MSLQITPVNKEEEENGKWTNYRGVDLLVARANTDKYKRAFRKAMAPYQRQIEDESLSEEKSIDLLTSLLSKHILLDWKNFPDFASTDSKATVSYSSENAKDLLSNDPDCLQFVQEFSNNLNNFLIEEAERFKGKSEKPSSGNSSTLEG